MILLLMGCLSGCTSQKYQVQCIGGPDQGFSTLKIECCRGLCYNRARIMAGAKNRVVKEEEPCDLLAHQGFILVGGEEVCGALPQRHT